MAKAKKISLNMALLVAIVSATNGGSYLFVSEADAAPFLAHNPPLVEVNPDANMRDANGNRPTRASAAGIALAASPAASAPVAVAAKPTFNLVAVDAPAPLARGRSKVGESTYPFDKMETPAPGKAVSFFVAATAEKPEPWKSLASTVSSAQRRYAVPETDANGQPVLKTTKRKGVATSVASLKPTRKFTVREIADGAPWGFPGQKGAAVYRTA